MNDLVHKNKNKHRGQKENTKKRRARLFMFKLTTILLFLIVVSFVIDSFIINNNKIQRNVYLGEYLFSGLEKEDFLSKISLLNEIISKKEIILEISQTTSILKANQIGFSLENKDFIWDTLYAIGREESIKERFFSWVQSFYKKTYISYSHLIHEEAYNKYVQEFERDARLQKVFEGSVEIKGFDIIKRVPQNGKKIDKEKLLFLLIPAFLDRNTETFIKVPLLINKFKRDPLIIELFYQKIQKMTEQTLILSNTKFEDLTVVLSIKDIIDILNISITNNPKIEPSVSIDDIKLAEKLIVLKAKDAEFLVNADYSVTIIPGKNGAQVNLEKTKNNIMTEMLKDKKGIVHIAIDDLFIPEFSNIDANRLGVYHVVSEFTTHYNCCVARAENIQNIARMLDNLIIEPGESLNINTFIGERTKEKGFKEAGSILKGQMVESIGGGISQFITTLHNALYWGAYEIVKHKPHSIYFSRYPHGIDATINWPYVDYIFKNDTKHAIVIDTEFTDTSITIRILGDNDGRIISGDHYRWNTPMKVIQEGGKKSRRVVSKVSNAYDFRNPVVHYVSDKSIKKGSPAVLIKTGKKGWKTLVDRKIYIGEELYKQDLWPVYYESGKETIYALSPCDNPSEENKPPYC